MNVLVRRPSGVEEEPGVTVRRIEPIDGPMLYWEHFSLMAGAGRALPMAAGSETVVYVLSGALRLGELPGIGGAVVAGGGQWLATGRRLTPRQTAVGGVPAQGIRFGMRLPRRSVLGVEFLQIDASGLPLERITGGSLRLIVDEEAGLHTVGALRCCDVQLEPGAVWYASVPEEGWALIYMVTGSAAVAGSDIDAGEAWAAAHEGSLRIEAREACRFVAAVKREKLKEGS